MAKERTNASKHLRVARGEIDQALVFLDRSKDRPLSAGPRKRKPQIGSGSTESAVTKPSRKRPPRPKVDISLTPDIDSKPPLPDFNPPKPGETEDFSPIPIPLYDSLFLMTLHGFERGDKTKILDSHSQSYVEQAGLMTKDDLHSLSSEEVMGKLLNTVLSEFKKYTDALEVQTAAKLSKDGLEKTNDFDSPFGADDEFSPQSIKSRIKQGLWRGTLADQKAESERKMRDREAELLDANVRAKGIVALSKYFELNEMLSPAEVHGQTASQLKDYFATRVEDRLSVDDQRLISANFDENVAPKNSEEYTKQTIDFIGIVGGIKDKRRFKTHKDVVDFVEKLKLISRDSADILNKTANQIYKTLTEATAAEEMVPRKPLARRILGKIPFIGRIGAHKTEKAVTGNRMPSEADRDGSENRNRRSRRDSRRNRYVAGPVGAAALGATALLAALGGGGAFLLGEYFESDKVPTNSNTLNIASGANVGNINQINNTGGGDAYGLVDNRNENAVAPSPTDGVVDRASEIKLSGDMNQDLAKLYLDNKSDNKIGDGIHIKANDAGEFFKSLGVKNNPERYVTLFNSFKDQDPTTGVVDLTTADFDVVAYDFRKENIELSNKDQSGLAAFSRDRTIDLDLPVVVVSKSPMPTESPTVTAAVTETATATPDKSATETPAVQPDKTPTAAGNKILTAVPTYKVVSNSETATLAVDFVTPTPTIVVISKIDSKKYAREQMIAMVYEQSKTSDKWLPFIPMPMFGGFLLRRDRKYLSKTLRKLLGIDDDEDDEDYKSVKPVLPT